MHTLSIKKYALLCVLGGTIAYTACLLYGFTLTGTSAEFHRTIFNLFPGSAQGGVSAWFFGVLTVAVWSGLSGVFVAWMHNASLTEK